MRVSSELVLLELLQLLTSGHYVERVEQAFSFEWLENYVFYSRPLARVVASRAQVNVLDEELEVVDMLAALPSALMRHQAERVGCLASVVYSRLLLILKGESGDVKIGQPHHLLLATLHEDVASPFRELSRVLLLSREA